MDADFSIELGREDPVLDFPWTDPSSKFAYVDLKRHPELLARIEEAQTFPELAEFLSMMNSPQSMVETAKCDVWATTELNAEEEIYNASHKFASYVDVVFTDAMFSHTFSDNAARLSLPAHEQFARKLVELLHRAPETPSMAEICVRRCYFAPDSQDSQDRKIEDEQVQEGCYCTVYVSGYGTDQPSARQNWAVALKLVGNATLQLSRVD